MCDKVGVVHFDIIWKPVDNIEPSRIPHNRKPTLFALNLLSRLCGHIISRQSPHPLWWRIKENQDSSPVTRCCQPSFWAARKCGNIAIASSFRFARKSSVNRCGTSCRWRVLNLIDWCKWWKTVVCNKESLSNWKCRFKRRIFSYCQDFYTDIIECRSSSSNFIVWAFPTMPYLTNPMLYRSECIAGITKLCL
jgi:hypothetical protein